MSWNKDVFEGVVLIEGLQNHIHFENHQLANYIPKNGTPHRISPPGPDFGRPNDIGEISV